MKATALPAFPSTDDNNRFILFFSKEASYPIAKRATEEAQAASG
jgi:hypothetical protein